MPVGLELPSWLPPDLDERGVNGVERHELLPSTDDFKLMSIKSLLRLFFALDDDDVDVAW